MIRIIGIGSPFGDDAAGLEAARQLAADPPPDAEVVVADRPGAGLIDLFDGADALIIVTEWKEFRSPDFGNLKGRLKQPVIFDGRNLYDPAMVRAAGLEYYSIGRA